MRQHHVQNEEFRLETQKKVKYKGTARIKLEWLHFHEIELRDLDIKNVERLKSVFRKECRRLDINHHIPALIDQQQLDASILASGVLPATLLSYPPNSYPELVFPAGYQLNCLHGRHRIQAGKEVLPRGDKWWTVDLYLAGKIKLFHEFNDRSNPFSQTSTTS